MKTPQQPYPKLAEVLGIPEVYLKREDLHPYGSHKGRSIPLMIKHYTKDGIRVFTISSSGNAALAAIKSVSQHNKNNHGKEVTLRVFVGKNIPSEKLVRLESQITNHGSQITVEQSERPKQSAFQLEKEGEAKFLRQSTDDLALEGYHELAIELNKIPNLQAIFIPTSSGTTAQALGETFITFNQHPQIHIAQTVACHPIVDCLTDFSAFPADQSVTPNNEMRSSELSPQTKFAPIQSMAGAIVDHIAHRKAKVAEVVKQSGGAGWIVTDDEIKDAIHIVKQTTNIDISPNSALSVAGLKKAVQNGFKPTGHVVCLITGA